MLNEASFHEHQLFFDPKSISLFRLRALRAIKIMCSRNWAKVGSWLEVWMCVVQLGYTNGSVGLT